MSRRSQKWKLRPVPQSRRSNASLGALIIVLVAKVVEPALLGGNVSGVGTCGFVLVLEMQTDIDCTIVQYCNCTFVLPTD
jgi:hypothetical protein